MRAVGLSRCDLDNGLTDPGITVDIGSALVVNTERGRRLVPVTPESAFNPFRWTMRPSVDRWRGYHRVATSMIAAQQDDGEFRRQVLASITELGTDMDAMFDGDARVVAEAVAICAAVGPHGAPLARDPKLLAFALRRAGETPTLSACAINSKLSIVPRTGRKIASLARRARHAAKFAP